MMMPMGCHVDVKTGDALSRDDRLVIVSLLHIFRGGVFFGLALAILDASGVFVLAALLGLFVARWFWSL